MSKIVVPARDMTHKIMIDGRNPGCVSGARRETAEILANWGRDSNTVDKAVLIVSEMLGNAIRHGYGEIVLRIERHGAQLEEIYISVFDQSSKQPQFRLASEESTDGRGLALILALSEAFGWSRHIGGGKTVWATL